MKTPRSAFAVAALVLGLGVAGCGSSNDPQGSSQGNGPVTNESGGQPGQGGPGGQGPGGSGKVAAVSGSTAQVQGQGGQVAVTWTSKTTFSQQIAATAADLEVGDCVVATPDLQNGSPDEDTSTVAATDVRITEPVDGSCTGGIRVQGDGPRREGGNPPEGAPDDAPSGGPRRGGFGAFGKVTAVDGSTFEVESTRPGESDSSTTKVTTTGDTEWTQTAKATAADVKVGRCVVSMGQADSTGAIKAASIAVSDPVEGECGAMFGRGFGRPGEGQGQEAQDS